MQHSNLKQEAIWFYHDYYKALKELKRINLKIAFGYNSKGGTINTESILVFVPQ